jgi:hypothetical protein
MARGVAGTVTVTVDDHEWSLVSSLRDAGSSDAVFVLNQETGSIGFGDGVHGARPRVGSLTERAVRGGGRWQDAGVRCLTVWTKKEPRVSGAKSREECLKERR